MEQTLVDLLNSTIDERNANRTELCRGLCSNATLSRYLFGERRMDRLLLTALMQRLGKSPDKFVSVLTDAEYRYFDWRLLVLDRLAEKDWEGVERLLSERGTADKELNEPMQEQFSLMMHGILQEKLRGDRKGAAEFFRRAVCATIPDFKGTLRPQSVLCVQEISALLLWQEYFGDEEISGAMMKFLVDYAYSCFDDEQERVKVYPRLAAAYLPFLQKKKDDQEVYTIAKRAFQMMTSLRYFICGEQILGAYIESAEKLGKTQEIAKKKVQLAAWCEMRKELHGYTGLASDNWLEDGFVRDLWQEPVLLREVIERRRRQRGLTQEVLSEGICTPETLSRIVTGKRAPSRRNFRALAQKLNVRSDYYYSVIEARDFRLLEERFLLDALIETDQWQKAEETARRLEGQLDMESRYNRQYLDEIYYLIELETKGIPGQERMGRLLEILRLTIPEYALGEDVREWPGAFWCTVFTSEEVSVMAHMVDALRRTGREKDAIYLTERLYAYYKTGTVRPEFYFRTFMTILDLLSILLGKAGRYEECLRYSYEGVALCFASRKMSSIGLFVNNIANAKECLGDKAFALRYYRYAFYSEELFERSSEIPRRSYEKLAGTSKEWY